MTSKNLLDFNLIKHYCGQDLSVRLQGAINNLHASTVRIVNTGMVNSGKSSLYNVLTGNIEKERFPTGAARTTTRADSYSYKDMEFIDTPGIDVRDIDDEIAYRTIMESDLILIVHNIKTGPLTRSETDWLERIAGGMKDVQMCKQRMAFVCTWKDTREHEAGYPEILAEVKRMAFGAIGTEIPCYDVSVKKYLDGVVKGKSALCEKSGIVELSAFLETHAGQYAGLKRQYALEALRRVADEAAAGLKSSQADQRISLERKQQEVKRRHDDRRKSWRSVFDSFKQRRETLEKLKKELNSI